MPPNAPYDQLAGEYYDSSHETSRNFDATTGDAIRRAGLRIPDGRLLDAGCGRGRAREYLGVNEAQVIQLDNSLGMLTMTPREGAAGRVLHRAEQLPFPDSEFSCVTAFLCDAFLGLSFLHEARRVLKNGGLLLGTTPSMEWGVPLRAALGIDQMVTRFVLRGGGEATVPSALYPFGQLRSMLLQAGFHERELLIRAHSLPVNASPVSRDIERPAAKLGLSPYELDILYFFSARRM